MSTPTLRAPRLMLTPPFLHEKMDVSHYLRWLNDPVVMQYSDQRHIKHTDTSQYEYICSFPGTPNYFWDIVFDGNPIGSASAFRDTHNKTANVGILLGTKHWGRGFGSEAWEAITDYLFDNGTRKIEAGCMASNKSMIRVLEKLSFTHEAIIHGHFLLHSNPEDMHLYGKFRSAKIFSLAEKAREAAEAKGSADNH